MSAVAHSGLARAVASDRLVVTAELGIPHGVDVGKIRTKADHLRGWVDAVNLTDNPGASVLPSSLAASRVLLDAGVEPVMQLVCRDRNRIGLQSDLLGAALLGIPNILLLTGDHTSFGDHPEAKPVFDLDSIQLIGAARTLRDRGVLLSGRPVSPPPAWFLGAVENPFAPPRDFRASRLAKKVAAGAQFAQTQFVFDVPAFARWMEQVRALGLDRRCAVLAGIGPIRSRRALEFLRRGVPGVHVPDALYRRLAAVPDHRFAREAFAHCVDTVAQVREIPGVGGIHVMAMGREQDVPELLDRAGISPVVDRTDSAPDFAVPANLTRGGRTDVG